MEVDNEEQLSNFRLYSKDFRTSQEDQCFDDNDDDITFDISCLECGAKNFITTRPSIYSNMLVLCDRCYYKNLIAGKLLYCSSWCFGCDRQYWCPDMTKYLFCKDCAVEKQEERKTNRQLDLEMTRFEQTGVLPVERCTLCGRKEIDSASLDVGPCASFCKKCSCFWDEYTVCKPVRYTPSPQ